jgi:membrane-associated phospholipid phosphatase
MGSSPRYPWLLRATIAVAMLAALTLAISVPSGVQRFDSVAVSNLHEETAEHELDWTHPSAFRKLGSESVTLVVATGGVLLLIALGRRRWALSLILAFAFTVLTVPLLKALTERRPPEGHAEHVHEFGFPSGHSATAMAVYGSLALFAASSVRGAARIAIWGACALLLAGIGGSAVSLGVRYPTDVLAGWLLAAVGVLVAWALIGDPDANAAPAASGAVEARLPRLTLRHLRWPAVSRAGIQQALKRVPGLVALVHGARRTRAELRSVAHGLTGLVGDLLAGAHARDRFRHQSVIRRVGPLASLGDGALDPYPEDAVFKLMPRGNHHDDDSLLVANLLHLHGLGPRIYDQFLLVDSGVERSVMALRNPGSESASPEQRNRVLERVSGLVDSGELVVTDEGWRQPENLRAREENDDVACYVGFENFRIGNPRKMVKNALSREARNDLHYGTEYAIKGGRYFYQSIPAISVAGRRNTRRRWNQISVMLEEAGISFGGRVTLDIGCNAGMMMAAALADGADWAVGWDLPHVARHARTLMLASGYTRVDVIGADLTRDYPLAADIPARLHPRLGGAIVLCLAFRHNVGYFPSALGELPWEAMVYEGGEEESVATLTESLRELRGMCDFSVASAIDFRDSETRSRPLALLVRSGLGGTRA